MEVRFLIKGVKIKKLKIISDNRGRLMEILRSDDEMFKKFGQVYMTTVKPNIVKGWHFHKKQSDKEFYETLKKAYKARPDIFMNPEKWKRLRLK